VTDFNLTLNIKKVGDKEALAALDDLDRKGRRIVEGVSGATGKAMGDVAVAYQRGGKAIRSSLEDVAEGHRIATREAERQGSAAQALATRQSTAVLSAARGLEQIARTGNLASSSLDTVIAQSSQIAFAFGATGAIVGSIGVATNAIVQMFQRATEEARKLAREMASEFERIAHQDVLAQGRTAGLLYSGDPNAADPMTANSIPELKRQRDAALARSQQTTMVGSRAGFTRVLSDDARAAAEEVKKLNTELQRRNDLLTSILGTNGRGGSLERAAAIKGIKPDKAAKPEKVKDVFFDEQGTIHAAKRAYDQAVERVARALEEEQAPIKRLAKTIQTQLGDTLGKAIADGLEAGFSGKGIGGAFEALTATVLGGLGSFMIQLGSQMIVVGITLDALAESLLSLNGPGAIAAGVALVAAGAGLKAIAGSFGGGASRGGGGSYSGASAGGGVASIIDRGVINPDAYSTRQGSMIPARPSVTNNVTIIGTNDPQAQRAWDELQRKSQQRGSLAGARG
jgi:hypothetical protein